LDDVEAIVRAFSEIWHQDAVRIQRARKLADALAHEVSANATNIAVIVPLRHDPFQFELQAFAKIKLPSPSLVRPRGFPKGGI